MKSNYKLLGKYIKQIRKKNTDGSVSVLKGIRINKEFMESVANIQGTDLSKYRVVEKHQFAYNPMHVGRDEILPISILLEDEPIIVSPAYVIFEILDHNILNPEYLMMWCRRSEFDRNVWFTTDSSVRGGFSWESLCELELPIPSIEKQHAIVKEYNTIVNRITLNETLNQKLEETAQDLYKHWFVDFEFPNAEGKPYKTFGGEMVYHEELEKNIPIEWDCKPLSDFMFYQEGPGIRNWQFVDEGTNFLNIRCMKGFDINLNICNKISDEEANVKYNHFLLKESDVVLATSGDHGKLGRSLIIRKDHLPLCLNTSIIRFNVLNDKAMYGYIYSMLISPDFIRRLNQNATGTKQGNFGPTHLDKMNGLLPSKETQLKYDEIISKIIDYRLLISTENKSLFLLSKVLLSKIAVA
jgi:type I restriction enzyme S subunit